LLPSSQLARLSHFPLNQRPVGQFRRSFCLHVSKAIEPQSVLKNHLRE
jgi:hypothetical protein